MAETPARRAPRSTPAQPVLGRVVHYATATEGAARAAVITAVYEDTVDLVVFNHLGANPITDVPFADEPTPGHYNWPPRA
ncbi:hypothetical protein JNUCC0626_40045 [Lentzea sp. JNUCC 0626]|uniref:hypothetical protein n=1 Tax=Lentzea sp. JNUCC 0626 TaxID=3367513 RepID=UPI003749D55E